jgi:predicted transcriptional regulator
MDANLEKNELVELTAEIVSAYVSNNTVVASELPAVIQNVFEALSKAATASGQPAR